MAFGDDIEELPTSGSSIAKGIVSKNMPVDQLEEVAFSTGIPSPVLKSNKIPMIDVSGKTIYADQGNLSRALQAGYKYESPADEHIRLKEEKFGDKEIQAGLAGAARGATFGLSDVAAKALGGETTKEYLAGLKEYNPVASTVGEVGGAIGSAVLLPVAAPTALVGRGAVVAGKAVVPVAEKIIGQYAAKLAGSAVSGALEGAAYGAGQAISDVTLDRTNQSLGEALLADAGMGAILGGAISGSLTLGGSALGKFGKIVKRNKQVEEMSDFIQGSTTQFGKEEIASAAAARAAAQAENITLDAGYVSGNKVLRNLQGQLAESGTLVASGARNTKDKIFDALSKRTDDVLADATASDITKDITGMNLKKQLSVPLSDAKSNLSGQYEALEAPVFKVISPGEKLLNKSIKELSNDAEIIGVINKKSNAGIKTMYEDYTADLLNSANLSQLKMVRTSINNDIGKLERAADWNGVSVLRKVKDKITDIREQSIKNAAKEATGEVKDAIKVALKDIESVRSIDKSWAQNETNARKLGEFLGFKVKGTKQLFDKMENAVTNENIVDRILSVKDPETIRFFKSTMPDAYESARKWKLGQIKEVSTVNGKIDTGKFLQEIKKLKSPEAKQAILGEQGFTTYKNLKTIYDIIPKNINTSNTDISAHLRNFFSPMANLQDAAAIAAIRGLPIVRDVVSKSEGKINNSLVRFITKPRMIKKEFIKAGTITGLSVFNHAEEMDKLAELAADPQKISDHLGALTENVAHMSPGVAAAMGEVSANAAQFLQSKAPRDTSQHGLLDGTDFRPSDAELSKFGRYVRAVDKPLSIMDDLEARILTLDQVEAVRTVYPTLYNRIVEKAIEHLEKKPKMSYQDKIQMAMLIGQPVSRDTSPEFIMGVQKSNIAPQQQGQTAPAPKGTKPINISNSFQSQSEKVLTRT